MKKVLPYAALAAFSFVLVFCSSAFSQDTFKEVETNDRNVITLEMDANSQDRIAVEANTPFHRTVIKAARNAHRAGKISRRKLIKLRVAMFSPTFREHAEDLIVTQWAFSGDEDIPLTPMGNVDREVIDWDGLIRFMEAFIPLLLKLLEGLG